MFAMLRPYVTKQLNGGTLLIMLVIIRLFVIQLRNSMITQPIPAPTGQTVLMVLSWTTAQTCV